MSVRNFERVFTREVGTTPSQYVLQMRVEAARRQLERTNGGLKQVASATGFGSVDVMRRAFVRLLGITPGRYRELSELRRVFGIARSRAAQEGHPRVGHRACVHQDAVRRALAGS
jgi:transcriptional regulator GlxA family with amidase domain